MDLLDQLAPLTTARPEIVSAVCAAWPEFKTLDPNRIKYDLHVLNNLGKVLQATDVMFLTENALLAFHLLNQPPKGLKRVLFASPQHAAAAREHLRPVDGDGALIHFDVAGDAGVESGADVIVVADFEDLYQHARAFEVFAGGGLRSMLLMFSSLNAPVRAFFNRCEDTGRYEAAHFPTTRGLSVLQKSGESPVAANTEASDLNEAWNELCAESEWTTIMEPHSRLIEEAAGWRDDGTDQQRGVAARFAAFKSTVRRVVAQTLPGPLELSGRQKIAAFAGRCSLLARQASSYMASAIPGYPGPSQVEPATPLRNSTVEPSRKAVNQAMNDVRRLIHADDDWQALREIIFGVFLNKTRTAFDGLAKRNGADRQPVTEMDSPVRVNPRNLAMLGRKLAEMREVAFWTTYWDTKRNRTWRLLLDQTPPQAGLLPKPIKPFEEYGGLYALQTIQRRDLRGSRNPRGKKGEASPVAMPLPSEPPTGGINHVIRKEMVVATIELLLRVLSRQFPGEKIRWLDLGCGAGKIINELNAPADLGDNYEFVGLDYNQSNVDRAIKYAQKNERANRRFYAGDALTPPKEIMAAPFHLVTAFEFMEHVIDPVTFVKSVMPHCAKYFMAGSPLAEKRSSKPAKAHVWSYERAGYEAIMQAAGLQITYSSEIRVGTYVGGHDWLIVVGSQGPGLARRMSMRRVRVRKPKADRLKNKEKQNKKQREAAEVLPADQ